MIKSLKYRMTHIKEESWHWQIVSTVLGDYAKGHVCTYYILKLPISALALFVVAVGYAIAICIRAVWVAIAWFLGWSFTRNLMDDSVTNERHYGAYKTTRNGTKKRYAPWEISLLLLICRLVWSAIPWIKYNASGVALFLGALASACLIIIFIRSLWDSPRVRSLRIKAQRSYNRNCKYIVVIKKENKRPEDTAHH